MLAASNLILRVIPSSSSPIAPTIVTSAPKDARFNATLPDPPILSSYWAISTTGTGASGEILFEVPCQ
jgi:hypothetical protein